MSDTSRAGQVFVRNVGHHQNGTPLLALVGIVPDLGVFKSEHQYTTIVREDGIVVLAHAGAIDLTDEMRGMDMGSALRMPVWRLG